MLEGVQNKTIHALLTGYPHCRYPAVIRATVTAMARIGERTWQYNLKPLPGSLSAGDLPEIPGVKSHVEVEAGVGGTVAIALLCGSPGQLVIVDEVIQ